MVGAELGLMACGEIPMRVGVGAVTASAAAADWPAPGVSTTTWAVPLGAVRPDGTVAVNSFAEMNWVERDVWFQKTADPVLKLAPLMSRLKGPLPAVTVGGLSWEITGIGILR